MTTTHRAIVLSCLIVFVATAASAQSRVQVLQNRSPIFAANFVTILAQVDAGAELIVIRAQGNWIEVLLPGLNPRRSTGFIASVNVEPVGGAPTRGATPSAPRSATPPPAVSEQQPPIATEPPRPVSERSAPRPSTAPRPASLLGTGIRGFGNVGASSFLAHQSFDAVLGSAPIPGHVRGPWYGGGVQFQSGHGAFFEGEIAFFRQTGQRVFVNGDTIFELGIPDTLTLMPVTATVGYRFRGRTLGPYIGGGIGQYLFSEKTPFDEPADHAWQKANSFHVLGGVELHATHGVGIAVQARYTRVPDALTDGVATVFNEADLGGFQVSAKLLVGR